MINIRSMRPLLLAALFFVGLGTALFGQSNALLRLAVVEFSTNNNADKTKEDAVTVRNLAESQLVASRKYQIITRDEIDKLLSEQRILASSISSSENVKKLQLQNISYIVTGSVDAMGSDYAVTVKILDVSTGQFSHSMNDFIGGNPQELYNGINTLMATFMAGIGSGGGEEGQRAQPPAHPSVPSNWTPASDFELALDGNGVTIAKYKGEAATVNIPTVIDGSPVVAIGDEAFSGCSGLTSITIPTSVTEIGEWAFYECSGLTSITVDALNTYYSSTNGILFSKDGKTLLYYPAGKMYTSYTLPTSVTAIGEGAFVECSGLTSITIPSSVTAIGWMTFSGCSGLTSITIPNSVTEIGIWAFSGCSGLSAASKEAIRGRFGGWVFGE